MRYSRLFIAPLVLLALVEGVRSQEVSQGAHAALTNSDVLQMVKSGLSPELVIAKIKASKTKFETSPALLTELKRNGVTENILVAMVEAGSADTVTPPSNQPDTNLEAARSALRTLRRLTTATEVGISYVNYSPLVADVKAEVDDVLSRMRNGNLKISIQSAMNEYAYAASVWQATWRSDFIDGPLRDAAINKYGVKKRGWLKVVWRDDFIHAIWREARNQFEVANGILSQAGTIPSSDSSQHKAKDDLLGAWKITLNGTNGQNVEVNLTVTESSDRYLGTFRSPWGNLENVQIDRNGSSFTLYGSEQEKKNTFSIQMAGTIESNFMKGNAAFSDGKQTGTLVFVGTRLAN